MINFKEVMLKKEKVPAIGDSVEVANYGMGVVEKIEEVLGTGGVPYSVYHIRLGEEVRHFVLESI